MLEAAASNPQMNPSVKVTTNEVHSGDAQLRKIARAGRKWKMSIGRKVDMESTYGFSSSISELHRSIGS